MSSLEEMKRKRDELEASIAEIKNQLQDAKSLCAADGVYSDRNWYVRASSALRIKAQQFNQLNRKIGEAEREVRRQRNDHRERAFIEVAKRVLTDETYKSIWAEVDAQEEA